MRINELKLYSSRLVEQIAFYKSILGLHCIDQTNEHASFQLGSSVLTIEFRAEATPYHFAINIPSNQENQALSWLKERVEILKDQSKEIQDFDFWNAKAMYFYDPDKNIVELIARKNLQNQSEAPFDSKHLLSISEIGIPTNTIERKYTFLNNLTGIREFSGGFDRFLSIGDENGLFICIDKRKKDWFPTGDKAYSSDFELRFNQEGNDYHIRFESDEIRVVPT